MKFARILQIALIVILCAVLGRFILKKPAGGELQDPAAGPKTSDGEEITLLLAPSAPEAQLAVPELPGLPQSIELQPKWKEMPAPVTAPSPYPPIVAEEGVPIDPGRWATAGVLQRTPTPDSVFDAKYPPDTEKGLIFGNSMLVSSEALQMITDRAKYQFETGDYEDVYLPVKVTPEGTVLDEMFYIPREENKFPRYAFRGKSKDLREGRMKIAFLRFADHPDIYEKLDEADYLRRRLAAMEEH